MTPNRKPRQLTTDGALQKIAAVAARNWENSTESLIGKQAAWIARRAGIAPDLARLVASLAFDGGRA